MNSIIMTAKEARDFDKAKAITLIKPIKPAPPEAAKVFVIHKETWEMESFYEPGEPCAERVKLPYIPGEPVCIREPWKRIGEKDRAVYHYAADAVSGPDNGNYFKWASPVSMPAAAFRYYGCVVSIEAKNIKDVGASWVIGLEKISKADAIIIEAGLPVSDAEDEDGVSEPYVYKGDMSAEDFGTMQAESAGERDEETEPPEDTSTEPGTVETTHKKRLEEIRARRQELEHFIMGKRLSEEAEKEVKAEFDALNAEEIAIMKADGIFAGFDFSALEPPVAIERVDEPPRSAQKADAETPDGEPQTDGTERPRGYSAGNCPFCGKAWHVILSGVPNGEYQTQEAADAAAGRACECVGPLSFHTYLELPPEEYGEKSEAYEPPPKTKEVFFGTCRFCSQVIDVGRGIYSEEAADAAAEDMCKCPNASRERRISEHVEEARDRIRQLFGENAGALGFEPIDAAEPVELLNASVALVARRHVSSVTMQIRGYCKAKVGITSKGKIKVERSEAHTCQLEAGE